MNENTNTSTKLNIGECRLSYVHLFTPEVFTDGSKKKYSVSIIIPKNNTKLVSQIKQAINAAQQAGVASKFGGKKPVELKNPLRDGDETFTDADGIEKRCKGEEFRGCHYINATSNTKPGIVKIMKINGVNKLVEVTDENEVYSGCYGIVNVGFYAFNNAGNKGIGAGLNNVMKTRDGDYLGGRTSAQTDFGGVNLDDYDPDNWDMPE